MATPNAKTLFELEQMMMGAAQPESAGTPAQYRTITANPVDLGNEEIDVSAPVVEPFKAPELKQTPIPESLKKKLFNTEGKSKRPLTDEEREFLAQREDDANHSTDVLVASLERMANAFANRPNDGQFAALSQKHSAEQIRKRERKQDRDVAEMKALAPAMKAEEKSALQRAMEDLNSPQSKRAQDAFITSGMANALKLSDDQVRGMSAAELEAVRKNVASSQQVLLSGQKIESGQREMKKEEGKLNYFADALKGQIPEEERQKLISSGDPDTAKSVWEQKVKEKNAAAASLRAAAKKAVEASKTEAEKVQKEVQLYGKEIRPLEEAERLTGIIEGISSSGKIPEGAARGFLSELTARQEVQNSLLLGPLARLAQTEAEKEVTRAIASINEAIAKASGGVVTISDREGAAIMSGLRPGASKEAQAQAIAGIRAKLSAARDNLSATWERGAAEYERRRAAQRQSSGNSSPQGAPKPAPSGKLQFQLPDGRKLQIPADKKADFLSKFPDAKEIK